MERFCVRTFLDLALAAVPISNRAEVSGLTSPSKSRRVYDHKPQHEIQQNIANVM